MNSENFKKNAFISLAGPGLNVVHEIFHLYCGTQEFIFSFKIYLFWLCWVFVAIGLSLVEPSGGPSVAVMHRLLIATASPVAEGGL